MDSNRLSEFYNEVHSLTAVCRTTHDWISGDHPELDVGRAYRVTHIGVLRSSSYVILEDFPGTEYCAGMFRILENGSEVQYARGMRFVAPYLRRMLMRRPLPSIRALERMAPDIVGTLEEKFGVEVLAVTLGGSRLYGFESEDSDWDIRFFYRRPDEPQDGENYGNDVLSYAFEYDVDALGWEFDRACDLIRDSVPEVLTAVDAPEIFSKGGVLGQLQRLKESSYDEARLRANLLDIYRMNLDSCMGGSIPRKSFIHALRAMLSYMWVEQKGEFPDASLYEMMERLVPEAGLREKICALIEFRRHSDGILRNVDPSVMEFLHRCADIRV